MRSAVQEIERVRAADVGQPETGPRLASRTMALLPELALGALAAFTVVAVLGYAVFGVRPANLQWLPEWAVAFYAYSFGFFALGHVWLSLAVLAAVLVQRVGLRWLGAFVLMYTVSLSSELAGTTWGLPFGDYRYSELLGTMWLGRVPVVIPLSWFFMALPSYALAAVVLRSSWARITVASLVLLAWDLALDPAMSYATKYWIWGGSGPYYGMPWLNLLGWYVTGLVLAGVLAALRADQWTSRIGTRWWAAFYGVNLALPLGMCAAAGLWGAVVATIAVLGLIALGLVVAGRAPLEAT